MCNVLIKYFDISVNQQSPIKDDFDRVVNYDQDGNEVVSYRKTDYPKIQKSHGNVDFWSLDYLLKAGISPDFSIHTGNPTRLEGVSSVQLYSDVADKIISENSDSKE